MLCSSLDVDNICTAAISSDRIIITWPYNSIITINANTKSKIITPRSIKDYSMNLFSCFYIENISTTSIWIVGIIPPSRYYSIITGNGDTISKIIIRRPITSSKFVDFRSGMDVIDVSSTTTKATNKLDTTFMISAAKVVTFTNQNALSWRAKSCYNVLFGPMIYGTL